MASVSRPRSFDNKPELMAIEPPDDRPFIEVWHTRDRGFGARIMRPSRNGDVSRSYLARYRDANGKDTKKVLGRFDEITYDDARHEAVNLVRRARDQRRDPSLAGPAMTVKQAFDGYIKERSIGERAISYESVRGYTKRIEIVDKYLAHLQARHVPTAFPWDQMPLVFCTESFWDDCYNYIVANHGEQSAKATARLVHAMYERLYALKQVPSNTATVLKRRGIYERSRNARHPVPRAQLPKLWHWLQNSTHPAVRDYILLGLLTGLRESVLGALEWENIDIDSRRIRVPPEARGNKRKQLVWMPVGDWVWEHIIEPRHKALAQQKEKRWLIPSMKRIGMPLRNVRGSFDALYKATGIRISDHDLRATFAGLAEHTMGSTKVAAQMLTHSASTMTDGSPAHTAGYIGVEDDDMRIGFNRVAHAFLYYATHKPTGKSPVKNLADWDTVVTTASSAELAVSLTPDDLQDQIVERFLAEQT